MINWPSINASFTKAFGETVIYYTTSTTPITISAIRSQHSTDGHFGVQGTSRKSIVFEIPTNIVTTIPHVGTRLTAADADWYVVARDDLPTLEGMWKIVVERTPAGLKR